MGFLESLHYFWMEKADQRVLDMPLIASAYQIPLLTFAYLYFVLYWGPRFMEKKQPYSLKTFIKLYNIVQIVVNAWLAYENLNTGMYTKSSLICPIADYSYDPISMKLTWYAWCYVLLKLLDFIETVMFVLRKKHNQISNLHLYHHVSTLHICWLSLRYYAIVPGIFLSLINSCVHVLMYIYYLLAACGPNIRNVIAPIKSWITIVQMVQFVILILFVSQNFIPGCKVASHYAVFIFIGNILINFYLFYNFYQNSYVKPKRKIL